MKGIRTEENSDKEGMKRRETEENEDKVGIKRTRKGRKW